MTPLKLQRPHAKLSRQPPVRSQDMRGHSLGVRARIESMCGVRGAPQKRGLRAPYLCCARRPFAATPSAIRGRVSATSGYRGLRLRPSLPVTDRLQQLLHLQIAMDVNPQ